MSLKSLNATLYNKDTIEEAIAYLKTNKLPSSLNSDSARYRFKRRWRGFVVGANDDLSYGGLFVVPAEATHKPSTLQRHKPVKSSL